MLKDVGAKLSNKLSVLVVDLNLMCWRPAKYKYYSWSGEGDRWLLVVLLDISIHLIGVARSLGA